MSTATLQLALDSPWGTSAVTWTILGITFHAAICPFEIDSKAWRLVGWYITVLAVSLLGYVWVSNYCFTAALLKITFNATIFNFGLASSILLYRTFLHRIDRFPGPFLARLSRFYSMVKAAKHLQANVEVQKLHEQYGDFVRVGPREISVNRPSAITAIYGPPTRCNKSPWYSQVDINVTNISLNSTRDMEIHRRRKRAWERGLGFRALSIYEPRIVAKVDLLLSKIDSKEGKPINMTEYAMFFGFDVMGDVGFSKDFRMLESQYEHPAIKGLHDNMTAVGVLGTVPWLMSMLSKIPGATGSYERFTNWCGQELKTKRQAMNSEKASSTNQEPRDVMSWLIRAEDENDRSAPPGEGAFQEDSRLMIIAGSDTVSVALANA